ncbi:MAG: chorismate mutase [Sphaerochaetaceae bacterium]|nr:chorismate mutase [Sphaerochaetaceae bacterium]MDD4218941.1 chorismate mutase [Sphaerochaetaceae bacterium]
MKLKLWAVRGAIQVQHDRREDILEGVQKLFNTICEANNLDEEDMVSLLFTVTVDLQSLNPASALRSQNTSFTVPLFCMQEPTISGMLPRTIRLMLHYYGDQDKSPKHVYLQGAAQLRPDLSFSDS